MLAVAVGGKALGGIEARCAAGDPIQHRGGDDGADHLGNDVGDHLGVREAPAGGKPDRDRRIKVAAGNMADGIGHGQHRQAERQRDAGEADAELGKAGGEDRRAASAERQPERADRLGGIFLRVHDISPISTLRSGGRPRAPAGRPVDAQRNRFGGFQQRRAGLRRLAVLQKIFKKAAKTQAESSVESLVTHGHSRFDLLHPRP